MKKILSLILTLTLTVFSMTGALAAACVDVTVSAEMTDDLRDQLGDSAELVDALLNVLSQMQLHFEYADAEGKAYAAGSLTLNDAALTCETLTDGEQVTIVTNLLPEKKLLATMNSFGFSAADMETAVTELMPVVMECAGLLGMSQEKVTVQELNAELDAVVITANADTVQDIIGKLQSINSANPVVQAVSEAAGMLSNISADVKLTLAMDETGMPVYAKAEANKADGTAALTVYTKAENDGRTLVKISGVGFDFARLNTSIRFGLTEDELNFELDVSIMEANGEFDLLWFDITAEKQDDGLSLSGMLQTTTTETEMTYEYTGMMTKTESNAIHTDLEILISKDSDELANVQVIADATENSTPVDLSAWESYAVIEAADTGTLIDELSQGAVQLVVELIQQLPEDVQSVLLGA